MSIYLSEPERLASEKTEYLTCPVALVNMNIPGKPFWDKAPAIFFAILLMLAADPLHAADPAAEPEFDPLADLQKFQQSYTNQEILPRNNANTGAAAYSIPVKVPPGRGGVQPSLALSYSNSAKNGWVGVGWSIEMGAIQRATKRGLDYAGNDVLQRQLHFQDLTTTYQIF